MPSPSCYGSIQACRLRVGVLDDGGAPDPGLENLYVTDALISVQTSYEIETGEEFTQKNGCGVICQTFKEDDKLKRVTLELQLCQFDYELLAMMLDATLITGNIVSPAAPIGIDLPPSTAAASNGVSLEVWTKAWDGGSQPVSAASDPLYHHFVWPKTTWVPGQRTLESGIMVVPVSGTGVENPQAGNGPANDWPATPQGAEMVFLDDEIPDSACGASELVAS